MLRFRQKKRFSGGTKKRILQIQVFPQSKHFISFSGTMKLRSIVTKAMKNTDKMVESGTICCTFTHLTLNSFKIAINLVSWRTSRLSVFQVMFNTQKRTKVQKKSKTSKLENGKNGASRPKSSAKKMLTKGNKKCLKSRNDVCFNLINQSINLISVRDC